MGWIGTPLRRIEDPPLLTGDAAFTEDVHLPGMAYVQFLRSPHAHARILRINVAPARQLPGVVAVVTGADTRGLGMPPVTRFFASMQVARPPLLAEDTVRCVGEPVAAVVAVSPAVARDALERVEVTWEPLPGVPTPAEALAPGAPVLYPELGSNRAFHHVWRSGDVGEAFRGAHRVVRVRVVQTPLAGVPLEPRAIVARWDRGAGELTVWISTQVPFRVRAELAAVLGLEENRVRVIVPRVGGGFGVKGGLYRDEAVAAWLALRLGRPVKWVATRAEDFVSTWHGRGATSEGELAVDPEGRIRGLRARIEVPVGAWLVVNGAGPARNHGRMLTGPYAVPAVAIEVTGAYTTTVPTGPYRGAGRPEGIFLTERLMDAAARALDLDPAELRRRNFVGPEAFPYATATGTRYDSGNYRAAFERALTLAGYGELRRTQARLRSRDQVMGIGVAAYVEPSALGWESGAVRVERTGAITVLTGSSPHGQGHETAWAQIVADVLGVAPTAVRVLHGDTRGVPPGVGTFGSRSTALGGSAVYRAAEAVRERARILAAQWLEAEPADLVLADGGFHVAGVRARRVTWAELAEAAYRAWPPGAPPGLEATVFFQGDDEAWSFGACVAVVAVDRDTGQVGLTSLVWVDDAGRIVNPLLAEGQLHGGGAQGAGQALLEAVMYDHQGQLLTASLMDYALVRAADLPEPLLSHTVTPSPLNPLGAKGLGEAGCIAVPPAVVNAVVDALAQWGCTHLDMPLTAEKVWRALRRPHPVD